MPDWKKLEKGREESTENVSFEEFGCKCLQRNGVGLEKILGLHSSHSKD